MPLGFGTDYSRLLECIDGFRAMLLPLVEAQEAKKAETPPVVVTQDARQGVTPPNGELQEARQPEDESEDWLIEWDRENMDRRIN